MADHLIQIYYSGVVQGVGFRYTTLNYAKQLNVSGTVRNLSDGRVEILVQGSPKEIEYLQKSIEQHYDGSILNKEVNRIASSQTFHGFEIIR